jgi:hypothetical protein
MFLPDTLLRFLLTLLAISYTYPARLADEAPTASPEIPQPWIT